MPIVFNNYIETLFSYKGRVALCCVIKLYNKYGSLLTHKEYFYVFGFFSFACGRDCMNFFFFSVLKM
jgi:hypothetical protein